MEIVLKLEGLVPIEFREFQDKHPGTETGFNKLCELQGFGIVANKKELNWDEMLVEITDEVHAGRFPLVSLRSEEQPNCHIYVAVKENDLICFLSRSYNNPNIIAKAPDDSGLAVMRYRKVDFVTYRKSSDSSQEASRVFQ